MRAFDLPCLEQAGFEADDLIATYARLATERGATTTIVSSDKDLMQLVTDKVVMYDTMKDRRIGIPEVIEKFGVPPEKVVEVQALAGDSTDNVPGVPGIGVKTAAQLIVEYGDLEQLLFRAAEIKQPKRREALIENAEKARISRQLVLLDDKVDLEVPLDDLAVHEPDARKLIAFLKAMEFSTLTKRVAEYSEIDPSDVTADGGGKSAAAPAPRAADQGVDLLSTFDGPTGKERGGAGGGAPAKPGDRSDKASSLKGTPISLAEARKEAARKLPVDRAKYQTIRTLDELKAWIGRAREAGRFAIELKANSIDPMQADICGIALALAPNDAAYVPLAHKQSGGGAGLFDAGLAPDQIKESDALEALKPLLESAGILKIGFNIKFGAVMLAQAGITLRNYEDVQLMSYALDAGRNAHGLDTLAELWLGHATLTHGELIGSGKNKLTFDQVAIDRATAYSAEDADVIVRLWRLLKPRLVADRMTTVYETLERPLVSVLARMERRGISIDRQVLSRLSGEFAQTAARVEAELQELAGEPINVGSPKQIGDIIFGKMGISGRHQDQDRRMVDLGADPRRSRRAGPRLPEEDSGMAPGLEAEIDLHRRAAGIRQSADPSRAHHLRAGRDHHGPAVVERAEPAEHPGSHRGRPQNPPRLHRNTRPQAGLGGLFADRAAAAGRDRRRARRCGRRSATGSTFTP